MNKRYFVFCLAFSVFASAQVINFPDANFKTKLLQPNVAHDNMENVLILDANNDGEIEVSEVQNVYGLNVSNANITDLSGISNFAALQFLNCNNNSLTNITIDSAIQLMGLSANHNNLTSLNLDLSSAAEGVDLSFNNLTSFAIEDAYFAEAFNLSHNQITSLTLNNVNFTYFYIDYNNLTSIEFVGNVGFYSGASFSNNQFTLLDLSNANFDPSCVLYLGYNPSDNVVFPDGSQPCVSYSSNNATFDMGNYSMVGYSCYAEQQGQIRILNCPNLTNLILKNGYNHTEHECNEGGTVFQNPSLDLTIQSCPNLSYICVDELEQPFVQATVNQQGFQNQIQVNSYCTFIPGGEFYTINGNTKFDFNANGCDTSDTVVSNQRFTITNGTEISTIISNDLASYHINVGAGNHTITPIIENPLAFSVSPANLSVNFPTQTSPVNQDFCISSLAPTHDFEITLIPIGIARPGFDANYKIVFKNTGNVIDTGSIVLTYQDTVLDFVSASTSPDTNSSGNLSWLFTNLMPFETRTINVAFNLNSPMETPPLNGNAVLSFTSSIAETGATQPFSNNHLLNQTVVNSFDPNDKICLEGQNLSNDFAGNYISYQIRFENTGTFAAENIVVADTIDTTRFDISTLMPISGSHNFYTKITANKAEFIFENINLPFDDANNDGYVVFKIKLLPEVIEGVTFANQASIYFDYNFPIVTNTATSAIGTLGTATFDFTNQFTLFPVPARNILQIHSEDNLEIRTTEIYNNLGQLVQKELGNQQNIDVSQLTKGSYYLKIKSNDSSYTKRFIKE